MIQESEVREKLIALLGDEITLDDFDSWLGRESWNMHLDSSREAQDLVSAVELALSEYSSGHIRDAELREQLRSLVEHVVTSVFIVMAPAVPSHLREAAARWFQLPEVSVPV